MRSGAISIVVRQTARVSMQSPERGSLLQAARTLKKLTLSVRRFAKVASS